MHASVIDNAISPVIDLLHSYQVARPAGQQLVFHAISHLDYCALTSHLRRAALFKRRTCTTLITLCSRFRSLHACRPLAVLHANHTIITMHAFYSHDRPAIITALTPACVPSPDPCMPWVKLKPSKYGVRSTEYYSWMEVRHDIQLASFHIWFWVRVWRQHSMCTRLDHGSCSIC